MQNLAKEQRRALNAFLPHRNELRSLEKSLVENPEVGSWLPTNFIASSRSKFEKQLPHGDTWIWTQSNPRVNIRIDTETEITFRKLNPRRKGLHNQKPPPLKVWLYEIKSGRSSEGVWYFVWCEKGPAGIRTEIGEIYPECLSICDLAFLSPFVERETALELGWL